MKRQLRQIYDDLSNGRLSQQQALEKIKALKLQDRGRKSGALMATPVWQAGDANVPVSPSAYTERHVVLCELPGRDLDIPHGRLLSLQSDDGENIAQRYGRYALGCFELLQAILQRKPQGKVLIQVVVANHQEQALFAGLSGLLKTAALESPQLIGQVILTSPAITSEELVGQLEAEKFHGPEPLIRYEQGVRQVLRWREMAEDRAAPPIAFRRGGVYLITGGAGSLGVLFAKEILAQPETRVVLAGRSLPSAEKQAQLDGLSGRVSYRQVDVVDPDQIRQLITGIVAEHGRLDGILHSAGVIADHLILKKASADFTQVLGPKVAGTCNLDEASRDIELDFLVLFSSLSGALGNVGQADYAAANGFMDQFAAYRNRRVAAGERYGRTRSINWPVWQDGGLGLDAAAEERLQQHTGMQPMQTATGIDAFHRSLVFLHDQILVAEGDLARMRIALFSGRPIQPELAPSIVATAAAAEIDPASFLEKTAEYLRRQCAELLKLPSQQIDPQAALEAYGIDSILAMKLTNQLEKTFGPLSKTLFFEYQTIADLSRYFIASHAGRLVTLFASSNGDQQTNAVVPPSEALPRVRVRRDPGSRAADRNTPAPPPAREHDPIAIIGLSGRYPEAVDLEAYWDNLRSGKDCIIEVPKERWDWREYFGDDRTQSGHHYSKWGGFIAGVDEFDPLFFNISPKEAKYLDPQERLFLQHAWMAVEDAGLTRASLQMPHAQDLPGQVGVYAGVMYTEYQLFGAESSMRGKRMGVAGSAASIANRVSYALNLHGPSVTLDTMCSSSLTAIHFACQDLRLGRTSLAIAGGVNVSIHPNKYLGLSAGQFISSDGHCQSFGEGGDGYIPGEGVGVVILKRLSEAKRDGDHIYGIIRGSALNHGGKTNGYTVPNPQAQASAIHRALAESHTDARHVSYIEAHGTGTKLGDPIEIAALNKAFRQSTQDTAFCLIGSAKSNIGHCESAAGIAGLTKVLLQMQHRQIVPSLHSTELNPHIDFEASPFTVNQTLRRWEQPVIDGRVVPRIAGISSFGAGGSNAHLIVEEYQAPAQVPTAFAKVAVLLSARTPEQLRQKARDLLQFLHHRLSTIDLPVLAYTLQVGREPMDERLGCVVSTVAQLIEKLEAYVGGQQNVEDAYQGEVKRNKEALAVFSVDVNLQQTVEKWIVNNQLSRLLDLWVKGLEVDWSLLYGDVRPQRISLPTYPFAKERYWIELAANEPAAAKEAATAVLHPLVHSNTSDLSQQSYSSTFSGNEFFLTDRRILPAAASLEMARVAVQKATRAAGESFLELRNVVWAQPIVITPHEQISIALLPNGDDRIDYEIYSREIIFSQGQAVRSGQAAPARLDLEQLARDGQQLVRLRLPSTLAETSADYGLHPILMEAAFQAAVGSSEPVALESLRIVSPCTSEMVAWVRRAPGAQAAEIDLCDEQGNVAVQMRGVRWQSASLEAAEPATRFAMARREITFVPSVQKERKKPAISLAMPGTVGAPQPSAGKVPITLANTAASEVPVASAARLFDDGNGIFSIQVSASTNAIAHLREALDKVQEEASIKVLLLSGIERAFPRGTRVECNDAIRQKIHQAIVSFPFPVIAVLPGDAVGAGLLAAALCDFMVCSEDARYGYTAASSPTTPEVNLFSERFGNVLAQDVLYLSVPSTGRELRAKGWTCPIVPTAQVEAFAEELASTLATRSREALRLLKQHLTRGLVGLVDALEPFDGVATVDLPGKENVLVVRITVAMDPERVFAEASSYRAIVLAGEAPTIPDEITGALQRLIVESPIPVVAAWEGNAKGNAWLIGLFCDAMVYSSGGVYSASGIGPGPAAAIFMHRLGHDAGKEILLTGADYRGVDLQQRVGALIVAEHDRVVPEAVKLAERLATLPRTLFPSWNEHSPIVPSEQEGESPAAPTVVALQSKVVTATAHPDGIVVVRMEDRDAKNMFSDVLMQGVAEVFTHIEQTPAYKVVVFTGYDSYFASGGTKESLLAIQEGKARFTDFKTFQIALDCKLPVIAAMQGHGIGVGWAMGMYADIALLSEESRYVSPYMNYGFTPGGGATFILADKIGQDLARESLLTAQQYAGSELKARGLRLRIVPRTEVESAAMELARQIARMPRARLIDLKRQLTAYMREPLEEAYRHELVMHEKTFVGQAGALEQIHANFRQETEASSVRLQPVPAPPRDGDVLPAVTATLRTLLANELQMRESDVDENVQFIDLGLDSIAGVTWIRKINEKYQTSIEATKVYSYPTLLQLSRYVKEEAEKLGMLARQPAMPVAEKPVAPQSVVAARLPVKKLTSWRNRAISGFTDAGVRGESQPIAVIGMAGQFPGARNLEEFWQNIAEGKNCITPVPSERWDVNAYYQPGEPASGKTNSQWVGALEEYDRFDPQFFNISPVEAETMDPQQRLFLQACWHSIENAGYDARSLSGSKCGVFVGCAQSDYRLLTREQQISAQSFTGDATSILPARASYFLNLQGPCLSIDTACSSSLVAIAQACDSLSSGSSELALTGGVYVMVGPEMHIRTAQAGMLSVEGKCFTFDQRADGFVSGEGVGVVVLKRLADAERDQDIIHAVIHGWGVNQDGKTNGITAPNPESQTRLEQEVYDRYRIDPAGIQLIETHGTGTKLGDPIEVEGLKKAFAKYTKNTEYCALGSVKSNIGHCLTAAGIAGVLKLVLAIRHKQLPPTINFERLNEHIDLTGSPFYINTRLQDWELRGAQRRQSAISSFGFSGTNAHLVIGEYLSQPEVRRPVSRFDQNTHIIPLSARTPEQLRQKARDLLGVIRNTPSIDLSEIAYTLQVGRTPMDERLGFVASSVEQLADQLEAYVDGEREIGDVHQGQVRRGRESLSVISQNEDIRKTVVDNLIANGKLSKLLELWVKGLELDWSKLYGEAKPQRITLPVYPFAKERYWIDTAASSAVAGRALTAALHPLLHVNSSDLSQQCYSTTFSGDEFFLMDHQVRADGRTAHKVLPGVAYLEMARAAIEHALPARPESAVLELRNTIWVKPVIVGESMAVHIALAANGDDEIDYEIYSRNGDEEIVHCQGRAVLSGPSAPAALDLEQLEQQMADRVEPSRVYAAFAGMGLLYGPSFQGVTAILRSSSQALARLRLPKVVEQTAGDYVLHPSLMDSALQACIGLIDSFEQSTQPRLPFALDAVRIVAPCNAEMVAWVRYAPGSHAGDTVVKLDIDLCDERGNVCVQMHGFSSRVPGEELRAPVGRLFAIPVWQADDVQTSAEAQWAEHHVVLCELSNIYVQQLPYDNCLSLDAGREQTIAQRYSDYALACFERIQVILRSKPQGKVLMQIVVPDRGEQSLFAGLSALLDTAALENPQFVGELVLVTPEVTTEELTEYLRKEKAGALDARIRYHGGRQVLRWQEVPEDDAPIAFHNDAVYLITGGLGALGLLFAKEILAHAPQARIVLTGRSPISAETQSKLDGLSGRATYRQVDLGDLDQVRHLIAGIRSEYGALNGILHSAGMIADNFILKKSGAEFRDVLEPKVAGTFHLDQASQDVALDFFVLFSSIAGAMGNAGQADYAAANGFMDRFAAYRNRQVAAGRRHGRTRSINWPLWQEGGIRLDQATQELVRKTTGVQPMQTATGMQAFHRSLAMPYDQVLVVEGDPVRMRNALLGAPPRRAARPAEHGVGISAENLAEKTQDYVRRQLSGVLKLPYQNIDAHTALETYGIDSILALKLTNQLEQTFGSLPKTLFFEYQTIGELTKYFIQSHPARLATLFAAPDGDRHQGESADVQPVAQVRSLPHRRHARFGSAAPRAAAHADPIAIIGLSGRYPESPDIAAYWDNLREGKDCIVEVPKERWDWREYFSEDRTKGGRHYSKWGGFIAGVDEFDPLFFNIAPKDAKAIDPQERLFLQHAWMAIEDAGYTRAGLQLPFEHDLAGQVGVYVGMMYSEYQLFGAEASMRGNRLGVAGSAASISNRVSFALNLHGPSMTLDTMCSSSLTAIHIACQDLKLGRTSLAIAGGVNVSIHPNKYLVLSAGQFISGDGHCQSFGEGGDGYIPGEGVGVVVLKRLSEARRDGDHIYGIIRGSALNHGGKTNGYTVPNPQAQTSAITRALAESHTDARHVSYIEAHGTGTKLGDPIEIAALSKAFQRDTQNTGFCLIGSAKSNIGHCESAAGIAGLTKVLLQMQHRQLAPSLHATQLNPHIDFPATPFVVNQSLRSWEPPVIDGRTLPRIAGISSFGAGGSNAHMIVEEYPQPVHEAAASGTVAILLSARTAEQLQQKARDLRDFIRVRLSTIDLAAMAYTLQVGREAMEERLGFVVGSPGQLLQKLDAHLAGEQGVEDVHQGQVKRNREALSVFSSDADLQQTVDKWIANGKLSRLLDLWVKGLELDWSKLYGEARPSRMSLPTYPFARERYWIDATPAEPAGARAAAVAVLHPLLHSNTSDLSQQSYGSTFGGDEFFLRDRSILTAAASLEMARVAVEKAAGETLLELRDVVWARPIVTTDRQISIALTASDDGQIDYEIYSGEIVFSQGQAVRSSPSAFARLDLELLKGQPAQGSERLVRLQLPSALTETARDYVLHPTLMESALQAAMGSADPTALQSLRIAGPCKGEMFARVRYAPGGQAADIDVCDERGNVAVQLRGVSWQSASLEVVEPLIGAPAFRAAAVWREIAFIPLAQTERKKPAISLAMPGAFGAAQPSAERMPITLSRAASSEAPVTSAVRLFDDGDGIFSIRIVAAKNAVAHLTQALSAVRQQTSVRVLLLSGIERAFPIGGRDEYNEAVQQKLYQAIVSFPHPVVAVLQGDAIGAGFMAAALCDFMVCSEDGRYGYAADSYPTAPEMLLFGERFGSILAQDLLNRPAASTGEQLRAKGWTGPIVPAAHVEAHAEQLASTLATKSQEALRLLKQHLTRGLITLVDGLAPVEVPAAIVSAAHENVLVVNVAAATDLERALAESGSKAIVLAGQYPAISDDVVGDLQRLIVQSQVPVVAALEGNAKGNAWLIGLLCDAAVYSSTGVYSAAGIGEGPAAAIFTHRFGNDAGKEILLTGADYRGVDLQQRTGALIVAEHDRVLPEAVKLAERLATLPRTSLPSWKEHTPIIPSEQEDEAPATSTAIALQSRVVTVTAHPDGIAVVTMEDRDAKNMFSDALMQGLTEAFAHIDRTPQYKVVILTGYDNYFASGGTKESLLAIQAGQAKFTDTRTFQLPLDCRLPVIAAMQGHGIGAGWPLGMFADLAVLSEESRYVSPYMSYGFTPGAGATWILADKIGQDLARESLLTGQQFVGAELKARGLRLPILPRIEVYGAAMALARQIARTSRARLVRLKQQLTAYMHEPLEETYRRELAMHEQTFVGRTDTLAQIQSNFRQEAEPSTVREWPVQVEATARAGDDVLPTVTASLRTLLANELQMRESDVDDAAQFVDLGLDSISGVTWIRKINEKYQTSIDATKVYSYSTLTQLSRYVKEEAEKHGTLSSATAPVAADEPAPSANRPAPAPPAATGRALKTLHSRRGRPASRSVESAPDSRSAQAVAIIGMAGQFPQAKNLEEFWRNVAEGRNCISRVPGERWDLNAYYQPGATVAGKTNSQWVGALEEYDLFDPLFFNISPTEAESMDPQQRLFLQACWHSIENAGYDASVLSGSKCGVFVGCATGDYHQQSRRHLLSAHGFTGSASSILAARISYFLNLQGPCVSIDTACSSSLVAIAQACDSLLSGASDLALAGGVYVMGGPELHIRTAQVGMLSPEGKCFTFDQRADGFVPGEGVGVVVLKRLTDAQRDQDIIYGVVQGWGVNQDGRTNGITAPNPESQTRLEQHVYDTYEIDPANIQLIEAHGTGTKLGDPIEVEGLKAAFKKYTKNKEYCAIGSVKSNVGHCLTAAGIAGVIKLLLALRHEQLPPTINFERLNEHIDLTDSPFFVNTRLQAWERRGAAQRLAAISSFGFSGTNAHIVIGEHMPPAPVGRLAPVVPQGTKIIVPLSARTADQLRQKAKDLLHFLGSEGASADLLEIAYTLQVGRTAMDERLGFVVSSRQQLAEKLRAYVDGERGIDEIYQGQVKRNKEALSLFSTDSDLQDTIDKWIANSKVSKLADLWVKGLELDWRKLYDGVNPRRISLPVYPFAKERYWIEATATKPSMEAVVSPSASATGVLHPLLHANTSDLSAQRYRSVFNGEEPFLADHRVNAQKVLPAVAYLEMARAAIELALPAEQESMLLELRDVVWAEPIVVTAKTEVSIALAANDDDEIEYEIYNQDIVYGQGRAILNREPAPARLDLEQLATQMRQEPSQPEEVYAAWEKMGLTYGPSFHAIIAVRRGNGQLLAHLQLPGGVTDRSGDFVLHPSLMNGAMQAAVGLIAGASESQPRLPFALESMCIVGPCSAQMVAWVRHAPGSQSGADVVKLDIDLCEESGNVCVQMRGLSLSAASSATEAMAAPQEIGSLVVTPVWQASSLEPSAEREFAEQHVILCELPTIDAAELPDHRCVSLQTAPAEAIAHRYRRYALACFGRIQTILQGEPRSELLVQIVIAGGQEQALLTGLSGLLRTAALENSRLTGQLIIVPPDTTSEELRRRLQEDATGRDALIRYEHGTRQVLRWQEVAAAESSPIAFKDHGVYLITGGLGSLGVLFAREILVRTRGARVILTGRSPLSAEKQVRLNGLSEQRDRVSYRQVDLGDLDQVKRLIAGIEEEYGRLDGILHGAGMTADGFIPKKTDAEFAGVLAPKVTGTYHLDEASQHVELDFLVLFSSVAGALGNPGQADYATANAFMDQFAAYRNHLVAEGQRQGRTRSINWPLWQDGGMSLDAPSLKLLKQTTGMQAMQTSTGLRAFHRSLASPYDQLLIVEGDLARITDYLQKAGILETTSKAEAYQYANKAEEFYSDVTSRASSDFKEEYLTFAPFEEKKPGFSMSRVLLNPEEHADEAAYVLAKQIEMRQVLFCKEDFEKLTSVLDFGCGHGTDVIQIGELFPHVQAHGCTITRDQAILGNERIARKNLDHDRVRIHHKDSSRGSFPSRYDLVFGVEVSFHIRDKAGLFDNICRALNDDGRILLADYISELQGSVNDPNVEISIPTRKEWARLTAQFGLEIDEIIDVSPEIANFLYDPDLNDNIGKLPEVTQKTLKNYANQSASLERGWLRYVLIKLKRNSAWSAEQIESHNLQKMQEPIAYPAALKAMYRQERVCYPPRVSAVRSSAAEAETAPGRRIRVIEAPSNHAPSNWTLEQLQQQLKTILSTVLGVETSMIDIDQSFSEFGLDSFLGVELIIAINQKFGTELSNIKVFDYPTVRELSAFLEKEITKLPGRVAQVAAAPAATPAAPMPMPAVSSSPGAKTRLRVRRLAAGNRRAPSDGRIAIVGMSGRYPKASNLNEYWENLAEGRNSIVEVPPSRWDVERHYDPDPAKKDKTNSRWLGALDDIDRFDPLFFRISPQEAEYMDPQHRLFLQESYRAFEDAGYSSTALSNTKCGVYLGISTNEYTSLLSRNGVLSAPVTSNSYAIAAARIAYYLNLKGPAIAVDTACSSSLVAIHLASQAILNGEIDMALTGGVSLWLTPDSYLAMSQAGMFSPGGQCKTFDDAADGIVVGEGVGALVLKRHADAEADGDFIYGVILGSGINQDGKTNGITAPSVNSQIELERGVYARYNIDPETITYVEAHGTGTKLGDPIELQALATVFEEKTSRKNFCALGAVKSNIGHTTAAAGVAGVQKVLLSMRHRTLVPTLNVTKGTSRFDFDNSPFYISRERKPWDVPPGSLRRAAISSFGFSGTNAHLVIEEYRSPAEQTVRTGEPRSFIVPLSARTPEQLRQRVQDLLAHVRNAQQLDLAAVAYTLQIGREAMEERLGLVVSSVEQLAQKLAACVNGEKNIEGVRQGRVESGNDGMAIISRDDDMQEAIEKWIARQKLAPLLDLWIRGLNFDWNKLYGDARPRRISLPTYPFAKERCWFDEIPVSRRLENDFKADEAMKSIEDIINQIADDAIETERAVEALKMLV